jgi:hypothetical protein
MADTDLDDRVLEEATDRGTLRAEELLALCEGYSTGDEEGKPGLTRETLVAYARALDDHEADVALDTHAEGLTDQETHAISDGLLIQELRTRRTDASEWEGEGIYVLDASEDRLSAFPATWHEAVGGETDLGELFRFLERVEPFRQDETAGTGKVSPDRLLALASAVGGLDPESARERLAELNEAGELVEVSESPSHAGLEARGIEGEEATDLPPTLDFRNALDEIEARSESDVEDTTDSIRDRLAAFAESDRAGRESLLSDIDRLTIDLESQVSGKAARRTEGIRNQIDAYRESDSDAPTELSLSGASLLDSAGEALDLAASEGTIASLRGTLVNGGEERGVVVMCAFYDDSGNPLRTVESPVHRLSPGEKRDVTIELYVPNDAARYGVVALDAAGSPAIGDARPTP